MTETQRLQGPSDFCGYQPKLAAPAACHSHCGGAVAGRACGKEGCSSQSGGTSSTGAAKRKAAPGGREAASTPTSTDGSAVRVQVRIRTPSDTTATSREAR